MKVTCPHGTEHEANDIHSLVILAESDENKAIIFDCSCSKRSWTLLRALKAGTFTEEQALKLRMAAFQVRQEA